MAEFEHEVIYCIVNSGFSDAVMDAAREFGAGGGTVIHARGTANLEAEKLFNISIYNATDYLNVVREYNDLFTCFEFPSIALKSTATQEIIDNAMLGYDGLKQDFTIHYYQWIFS